MTDHAPGPGASNDDLEARKERLRDAFRRGRGYYDPIWDDIIGLDIDYFEQYEKFSSVPWHHGALDRKTKELIAIALNASVTHMYLPGVRSHIRQALRFGATRQEIMEVFELVSVLGVHSLTVGLPIFLEELDAHEARAATDPAAPGGEATA
jgi:alkylhydroperoxidase/carboxymuconolactone decarboxylase family protein YurZ